VISRPNGDPATAATVCPGLHHIGTHAVVWWDPRALHLDAAPPAGVRYADLIAKKDVADAAIEAGMAEYRAWHTARASAIARGRVPSVAVETVTARVHADAAASPAHVEVIRIASDRARPRGRSFGVLLHAVLAAAPLDGGQPVLGDLAASIGRALGASDEEIAAAADRAEAVLREPLFDRVREAWAAGRCRRETPIGWRADTGTLVEGVLDLAFEDADGWTVADFKTDEDPEATQAMHSRQIAVYATAVREATGRGVRSVLIYL
jgi:ATP-dependent exoDNAse (exonuclease V) beta subunit